MKCARLVLSACLILLATHPVLWAEPTTDYDAEMVVTGWLRIDPEPLVKELNELFSEKKAENEQKTEES